MAAIYKNGDYIPQPDDIQVVDIPEPKQKAKKVTKQK